MFCLPTSNFLPNLGPKLSELAAVETPVQFKAEKLLFCLLTISFLPSPVPEPSPQPQPQPLGPPGSFGDPRSPGHSAKGRGVWTHFGKELICKKKVAGQKHSKIL